MNASALSSYAFGTEADTRLLLEAMVEPGVSFVCRIAPAATKPPGSGAPLSFWCAYYGTSILANGWQPYDQPTASAYMPWPFAEFEKLPISSGGVLLLQRAPRHSRAVLGIARSDVPSVARRPASVETAEAHVLDLVRGCTVAPWDEHHLREMIRSRSARLVADI